MIRRTETEDGIVITFPYDARTTVAAASLAVPLSGASRDTAVLAPLVAACWASSVAAITRSHGCDIRVRPFVTADLVGITAEALSTARGALSALPQWLLPHWLDGVPPLPDAAKFERLRAQCLSRLSEHERKTDEARLRIFGGAHRYGIGYRERAGRLRAADPAEVAAASVELVRGGARPVRVLARDPGLAGGGGGGRGQHVPLPDFPATTPSATTSPPRTAIGVRHQAYRTGGGRAGGERAFYCASAPGVALGSPWKFPLHVAWALLGGREGLLDRRLRRERALTYALAAFSRELAEGGYGVCFAECPAGAVDEVAGQVAEAFGELAVGGTEPAALRSARERLIIRQHAAVQAECDLAERLCGYELAGVDPAQYAAYPARIAAVGPAELCAAAAAFLRPD